MEIAIIIVVLMYSVILHELGHGVVAYFNGDRTAKEAGRLTLNPIPHIDLFGTILLPALLIYMKSPILFGWAKPVPFNPLYFRNRNLGIFTVGIAGPLTNIILAIVFSISLRLGGAEGLFAPVLYYGASINLILAIFNLLPIPPLDGSRAVSVLMPRELKMIWFSLDRWGFFIIILLLYTGIIHRFIVPLYLKLFSFLTGIS